MSSGVDTRVVQIQFDNKEFERNVQQTIDSLERLNRTLERANASENIGRMAERMEDTDFSRVVSGVEAIKDRFSTLGIIGMTVLQRLTNAGIDMALKIGGSIKKVGDQIAQGGFVRAQNLEQAKFLLEGLGADVTAVMKDVDDALTGTAYGLDEGAKSAAIFFTSGVKQGKEMYTALRAVAGAAAMTGNSYQGIADVFQDAAAKGSIMTMEIQRLQQQGVKADKYLLDFINDVVEGGKKVEGVSDSVKSKVMDLTNGTKLSLQDLTEDRKGLLSKGAIEFEVFAAAMDYAFGAHAQEANKTFSGSLANMKTALSRLGEAFITPGMKAAIPLFNGLQAAIKEFANYLIKDYKTVDFFTRSINSVSEAVTGFVKKASELGIIRDIARITDSAIRIMSKAGGIMADSIQKMFPKVTLENAAKLISKIRESISRFKTSGEGFEKFRESFERFLKIIKQIGGPFAEVFKTLGHIIKSQFGNTLEIILNLGEAFSKVLGVALKAINGILTRLTKPIDYVMNAFVRLSDGINKGFSKGGLVKVIELFGKAMDGAAKLIGKAFDKVLEYISLFTEGSKHVLSDVHSVADALGIVGAVFGGGFIAKIIKTIKEFFDTKDSFKDGFTEMFESIKAIPEKVTEGLDALTESLKTMQKQVSGKIIKDIAVAVLALALALKILSTIDIPGLAKGLSAVTILLGEMIGALTIIMKMFESDKFSKSLKNISKLQIFTTQLVKLGLAMILMASALKIMSTIDPQGLAVGLTGLVVILGAVLGFVVALDKFGGRKMAGKFKGVTEGLMGLAFALLVLSAAVKVIASLKIEQLAKGLTGVVVLLSAIMGFIVGVSKLSKGGAKGMITTGIGMIAIATALNILAPALERMGSMDMQTIGKGLIAISGALIAMAGAAMFTSGVGAGGILVMSVALTILASTIERIGKLDVRVIAVGFIALIGSIVAFAGASMLLSAAIVPMLGISAAMLALSAAIAVLGAGLIMIGAGLASIAGGIMAFAGVSQTALMMFANSVQIMISAIINMLPQVAIALAESFVTFLEQIAALAPRFTEAATTLIHSLLEAFENNIPDIIASGLRMIIKFLDGMSEAIPKIAQKGVEIIAGFLEGIASGMDRIIQAGVDLMLAFINGLANGIRRNKDAVRDAILNLCEAMLEAFMSFFGIASPSTVMEQQGVFIGQGLIQGLGSMTGAVGKALVGMVTSGFARVKTFGGKFKSAGKTIIDGLIGGIKSHASKLGTNLKNAVSKGLSAVTNIAGRFKNAGKNLVDGIARGIRNGASSIISATGSIASRALKAFKSKLGISSPSKVFAAEARWIPEGIVVGINKTSNKVKAAVEALSESAIDPLGDAISKAYSAFESDSDFNPTITPVLDLSQVRKEAGNVSSMFGNESISLASSIGPNDIQNIQSNNLMNQLLTKMDRMLNATNSRTANITNTFTVNGADNAEEFVNTFIRTLDREMKMRAV